MKKCICFSRVSTVQQDLEAQQSAILKVALKDYKSSEIISVSGKESAIKLSEEERQTLNEIKELVSEHPTIESIYFYSVDRLARRVSVVMSIKEWADEKHINLVFLNPYPFQTWFRNTDGRWTKNDISDVYLMFLSFGASMEMRIKNERFASAKAYLKSQHKHVTGHILLGYRKNADKYLEIDPATAPIVNWVFKSYLERDMSTVKIYDEGVDLGYFKRLTKRSSQANRIRSMLMNYAYAGDDPVYPAIVSRETVDAAIARMKEMIKLPKTTSKHLYLCKGLIRDEDTGLMLHANKYRSIYASRTDYGIERFAVNLDVCDTVIWRSAYEAKWISLSIKDDDQKESTRQQIQEISTKIVNLKDYIENTIKPKYTKAYTGYINSGGRITEEMYNNIIKELDKEQKEIQSKIDSLDKREAELMAYLNELLTKEKRDVSLESIMGITDDTLKREIIEEVIKGMSVKKIARNRYYIKVETVLPGPVKEFLYLPRMKRILYQVMGNVDIENLDVKALEESGDIMDITSGIEHRFKP